MSQRRRMKRAPGKHADDWLLTYADTITLLLCLFVVLLAYQVHKSELAQGPMPAGPVEQPVMPADFLNWKPTFQPTPLPATATDDDDGTGAENRAPTAVSQDPLLPGVNRPALPVPAPSPAELTIAAEPLSPADTPVGTGSILQPVPGPAILADAVPQQPGAGSTVPLSEIVAHVTPDGAAHLEQEGDRITALEFDSTAFFSRGDATLNSSGKVILQQLVGTLKSEEYRDYIITIEGHTDDAPINTTQFPSNWELSTARAAAVVRFFVEQGIPPQRLRAAGYADTRPLEPNRDGNGIAIPANQARNRRVVIGLEKIELH